MAFNVFLNEQSLHAQFSSEEAVGGVKELCRCIDLLKQCNGDGHNHYYIPEALYMREILEDSTNLHSFLSQHKEYKTQLRNKLNLFVTCPMTADPISGYGCQGLIYKFSSIGEAYENQPAYPTSILNWICSIFPEPDVVITLNRESRTVHSFCTAEVLSDFLTSNGWLGRQYDKSSSIPPRDPETILSDATLFEPTPHTYQGRRIYHRIDTNELWYVDNLHYGSDAHLEVFSETEKKQIHVSSIDAIDYFRDLTPKEKKRTLRFDGDN